MRQMEFTMSRPNLVKQGDEVEITEESFQAVIIILLSQQLLCQAITQLLTGLSQDGVVKEVGETSRGYYVLAEFED